MVHPASGPWLSCKGSEEMAFNVMVDGSCVAGSCCRRQVPVGRTRCELPMDCPRSQTSPPMEPDAKFRYQKERERNKVILT